MVDSPQKQRAESSFIALAFVLAVLLSVLFVAAHALVFMHLPAWPYETRTTLVGILPSMITAILLYIYYRDVRRGQRRKILTIVLAAILILSAVWAYRYAAFAFVRYAWPVFATAVLLQTLSLARPAWFPGVLSTLRSLAFYAAFLIVLSELPLIYFHVKMYTSGKSAVMDFPDLFDGSNPGLLKKNLNEAMLLGDGSTGLVRTNEFGFRSNHDMILPKPSDELRILMLGDSFTIGYRTDQNKTAATLLEGMLQDAFPERQVRIYVARAMDQSSLEVWLRKNRGRFEEDVVLHGITIGNDLPVTYTERYLIKNRIGLTPLQYYAQEFGRLYLPPAALYQGKGRSQVCSLLPEDQLQCLRGVLRVETLIALFRPTAIYNYRSAAEGKVMMWDQQNDLGLFLKDLDPSGEEFYRAVDEVLGEIAAEQRNAAPLHLFLYPQRFQQSEGEWKATRDWFGLNDDAFDLDQPNRRLLATCAKHGLSCRDLLPAFREQGAKLLHYPYDMHWNNAGNAVAAGAMLDYLQPRIAELLRTSRR